LMKSFPRCVGFANATLRAFIMILMQFIDI